MKNLLLLLALLSLGGRALAEDNTAKLALAREAVSAMQADKIFEGLKGQMAQMASQLATVPPDATAEQKQLAEEFMKTVIDLSLTEAKAMSEQMNEVYAAVYSEAELKAMIAFLKTTEGQAMVAKQPEIMQQLIPKVQAMQQTLMPKLQALAQEFQAKFAAAKAPAAPAAPAVPPAPETPAAPAAQK